MNYNSVIAQLLFCIKHVDIYGWKDIFTKVDFYINEKSYNKMIEILDKYKIEDKELKLVCFCVLSGNQNKDEELFSLTIACCLYDLIENGIFSFTDNAMQASKEKALAIHKKLDNDSIEEINKIFFKHKKTNEIDLLKKKYSVFKYFCFNLF